MLSLGMMLTAGCDQKPQPVEQYGKGLIDAKTRAEGAAEQANLDAVRKAVQAYRAANDSFPPSLQDVAGLIGGNLDLSKYDYDPQAGTVKLK